MSSHMSVIIRDYVISYISHNSETDIYVISGGYVFLSYDWASCLLSLPPCIELADLFTTVIVVITMFYNTPLHLDCLLFEEIAKKMFFLPRKDFLWPAFMLKC